MRRSVLKANVDEYEDGVREQILPARVLHARQHEDALMRRVATGQRAVVAHKIPGFMSGVMMATADLRNQFGSGVVEVLNAFAAEMELSAEGEMARQFFDGTPPDGMDCAIARNLLAQRPKRPSGLWSVYAQEAIRPQCVVAAPAFADGVLMTRVSVRHQFGPMILRAFQTAGDLQYEWLNLQGREESEKYFYLPSVPTPADVSKVSELWKMANTYSSSSAPSTLS